MIMKLGQENMPAKQKIMYRDIIKSISKKPVMANELFQRLCPSKKKTVLLHLQIKIKIDRQRQQQSKKLMTFIKTKFEKSYMSSGFEKKYRL